MIHRSLVVLATLAVGALASGCSSNSSTPDTDAGGPETGALETFSDVYDTVLQPTCSSHHNPTGQDSFLDFSSKSAAYTSLVGVKASGPACGATADGGPTPYVRVVVGSATTSLLYEKVSEPTPPCGEQMPYGGPYLSSTDQAKILAWILAGAQND